MLRSLYPVYKLAVLTWWRWALRELQSWNPMHPDVPMIVRRINELEGLQ